MNKMSLFAWKCSCAIWIIKNSIILESLYTTLNTDNVDCEAIVYQIKQAHSFLFA